MQTASFGRPLEWPETPRVHCHWASCGQSPGLQTRARLLLPETDTLKTKQALGQSPRHKARHEPSSVTDVLGGDLGLGAGDVSVFRGRGVVLHRSRQRRRLVNDQYVVFVVLAQVLLGKIEALHAGDLQLKQQATVNLNAGRRKRDATAGEAVSATFRLNVVPAVPPT